jgi:hypothetical protein
MIPLLETTAAVATPACRAATANRKNPYQQRSGNSFTEAGDEFEIQRERKQRKGKERGGGGRRRNFGRIIAHVISKESAEGQQQE